jgi:hypothetical protein
MCLNQNSLKRAYAYYLEQKQQQIDLSEICDMIRENTDANLYIPRTNIKTILRREKKHKYYEYVDQLYSILNNVPKPPSVWQCHELDRVFALYNQWWSIVDHEKNYCINPTKMAQCYYINF